MSKRIFMLEDHYDRVFELKCAWPHLEIFNAPTVEEGKKLFGSGNYDLLLLDHDLDGSYNMDSMNPNSGFAFVIFLKSLAFTNKIRTDIPIIVHSHNNEGSGLMTESLQQVFTNVQRIKFFNLINAWYHGRVTLFNETVNDIRYDSRLLKQYTIL